MSNLILSVDPDIMGDSRLDLLDKLIYSYITTWEQKRQVCFAKDDLFIRLFGVTQSEVDFSLIKLKELHLILEVKGNGGRLLQTAKPIIEDIRHECRDVFEGLY